jgi:hypothetical protein
MKKLVLDTFTPTKAHSMTPSGQCRLSPVIPWTNDSSRIVEILGKMLRQLHRSSIKVNSCNNVALLVRPWNPC